MENKQSLPNLSNSTPLETWSGDPIWAKGYILRQLPSQNGNPPIVAPVPIFFDPRTGRILTNILPPEIRSEYEEFTDNNPSSEDLNNNPTFSNDSSTPSWGGSTSQPNQDWGRWESSLNSQEVQTENPPLKWGN